MGFKKMTPSDDATPACGLSWAPHNCNNSSFAGTALTHQVSPRPGMQSLILPPRDEPKAFSAPQRLSFNAELTTSTSPRKYRAGWISDAHLGTRGANAGALLAFLREHDFETLYVVGDLIDVWSMRRARYWPQQHNDVIQKILRKARKGDPRRLYSGQSRRTGQRFQRQLRQHRHLATRHPRHRHGTAHSRHPRARA